MGEGSRFAHPALCWPCGVSWTRPWTGAISDIIPRLATPLTDSLVGELLVAVIRPLLVQSFLPSTGLQAATAALPAGELTLWSTSATTPHTISLSTAIPKAVCRVLGCCNCTWTRSGKEIVKRGVLVVKDPVHSGASVIIYSLFE